MVWQQASEQQLLTPGPRWSPLAGPKAEQVSVQALEAPASYLPAEASSGARGLLRSGSACSSLPSPALYVLASHLVVQCPLSAPRSCVRSGNGGCCQLRDPW